MADGRALKREMKSPKRKLHWSSVNKRPGKLGQGKKEAQRRGMYGARTDLALTSLSRRSLGIDAAKVLFLHRKPLP